MAGASPPGPPSGETDGPDPTAVVPRPALPRTLGIANVLLGSCFFLCGLGCLRVTSAVLDQIHTVKLDQDAAQAMFDQIRRDRITELQRQEDAAPAGASKAALKTKREALAAEHPKVKKPIDFPAINQQLRWPSYYLWADVITGPMLNLLMLASGIGLIQLRGWARKLALWVAGLKIVRLVALAGMLMIVVIPHLSDAFAILMNTEVGDEILRTIEEKQGQPGMPVGAPPIDLRNLGPALRGGGSVVTVFTLGLALIYPILTLVVLTRPAVRAACVAVDPEPPEEERQTW